MGRLGSNLKKLSTLEVEEAVSLYQTGASLGDLAIRYRVSRQSMWDLLRRRIKLRPKVRYGAQNNFYRGGARALDSAQNKAEKAIKRGSLVPLACETCGVTGTFKNGRNKIQGHHDDYAKPLEVRWLCQSCHYNWHRVNGPGKNAKQKAENELLSPH